MFWYSDQDVNLAIRAREVVHVAVAAGSNNEYRLKVVSIQVVESQFEFVLLRLLDAGRQTCQVVRTLVEVSMVQVVFVLKEARRHGHDKVDRKLVIIACRNLQRVAASRIDTSRSFVL